MKNPLDLCPLLSASRTTRLLLAGLGGLAVSALAATGHADIYKQVDADGTIAMSVVICCAGTS